MVGQCLARRGTQLCCFHPSPLYYFATPTPKLGDSGFIADPAKLTLHNTNLVYNKC
jgi:hypothetical protein